MVEGFFVCGVCMQVVLSSERSSRLLTADCLDILSSSIILSFYFIASTIDLVFIFYLSRASLALESFFYKMFSHLMFLQNLSSIKYFLKQLNGKHYIEQDSKARDVRDE